MNPDKTEDRQLIASFGCDYHTVDEEFLLSKQEYEYLTGRNQGAKNILAYHIRQSFKPGEISPEEALDVGNELAARFTKNKHAYIVAVHTDKKHIHCHVVYNSTNLDCTGKFDNFYRSSYAVRHLSDLICLEHGLSVIENPKPSKGRDYGDWLGNVNEYERSSCAVHTAAKRCLGYEHWARIFNIKEAAKTLMFLKENGIDSYDDLVKKSSDASDDFDARLDRINDIEKRLKEISELQKHIGIYGKTREIYQEFKSSKNKAEFFEAHRADITLHKAAKKYFDGLKLKKLPRISNLKQEYAALLSEKKKLYTGYHAEKKNMRELLIAKNNADRILGVDKNVPELGNPHYTPTRISHNR